MHFTDEFTNVVAMNNLSGVILYLQNPEAAKHDEDSNFGPSIKYVTLEGEGGPRKCDSLW